MKKLSKKVFEKMTKEELLTVLKNALEKAILKDKPTDYGIDEDSWFMPNRNGKLGWTWQNKDYPMIMVADKMGIKHLYFQHVNYDEQGKVSASVIRKSTVKKAMKAAQDAADS